MKLHKCEQGGERRRRRKQEEEEEKPIIAEYMLGRGMGRRGGIDAVQI